MEWCRLIPEETVAEIKERTSIDQLIGEYVQLKPRGTTRVGLCPFHSEKTPSFTVWPADGHFHCFGCGVGGDAVTFVRMAENLDYVEALKFLADRAGITIPEESSGSGLDAKLRARTLELNRFAALYFYRRLSEPEGAPALEYFRRRRLSAASVKRFGLGYSPENRAALSSAALAAGFSADDLKTARLVSEYDGKLYDIFSGRVIFPILDRNGGVIGFGGRIMDTDARNSSGDPPPKYLNSGDTPAFRKKNNLYALNYAKKSKAGSLILAEGYMDVIALHQAGFTQAVATLGTALTVEQARLMSRYTQDVIIAYDSDEAGVRATQKASKLLRDAGIHTKVLQMRGAKDPDEYIARFGREKFQVLLSGSADALLFRIEKTKEKYDLSIPAEKSKCVNEIIDLLCEIKNLVERNVYRDRVSSDFGIDPQALEKEIRKRLDPNRGGRAESQRLVSADFMMPKPENDYSQLCVGILSYIWRNPSEISAVCEMLPEGRLHDEFWDGILSYAKGFGGAEIDFTPLGEERTVEEMNRISAVFVKTGAPCRTAADLKKYTDKINLIYAEKQMKAGTGDIAGYLELLKKSKK